MTKAGRLKARYVIHAASMHPGGIATTKSIADSVKNSLLRAEEQNLKTIAFPAVGCGIAGFSIQDGAPIILRTLHQFNPQGLELATVVLFSQADYNTFEDALNNLFQ